MKLVFTFFLLASVQSVVISQSFPEFSVLSGRDTRTFSWAKAMGSYYYLQNGFLDGQRVMKIHRLDYDGRLLDSFNLRPDSVNRAGWIKAVDDRLFFHGLKWTGNPFKNMRHTFIEYSKDLSIISETEQASFNYSMGRINLIESETITNEKIVDFNIYKDTVFSIYNFIVVDSPSTVLGRRNYFIKSSIDGVVYSFKEVPANNTYNLFFVDNKLYLQGSEGVFLSPKPLIEFNSEANVIRGIDYDRYDSGGTLHGATGGWHKGRFYFSYVGNDPDLSGCTFKNAAIDVRDSMWKVLYRFKLPDCGYQVSGKMPFSFDAQNNVYYAAPHESYKKIMLYKFTPDFQLLWKRALDFTDAIGFYYPLSHLPADDGGILLNCYEKINAIQNLRIFKISSDGNVVSSTRLPGGAGSATGPLAFPNPTTGPLTLAPEYAAATQAQLSTLDGRHLGFISVQNGQMDISAQPAGVYTLTLWDMKARKMLGAQMIVKE